MCSLVRRNSWNFFNRSKAGFSNCNPWMAQRGRLSRVSARKPEIWTEEASVAELLVKAIVIAKWKPKSLTQVRASRTKVGNLGGTCNRRVDQKPIID